MSPRFRKAHRPPVANYRPISITSVLSRVFERLVSVRLRRFMEQGGALPTTQFAYRKGLGTCDAYLCVFNTLQRVLVSGQEDKIVQIDFNEAFDRVNHLRILFKLCSVSIGSLRELRSLIFRNWVYFKLIYIYVLI